MAGEGIIQLYSGRMFNVRQPRPEDIIFEDIATSLSRLARFNGHSQKFYSVAQHSVLVTLLVPSVCRDRFAFMTPHDILDCQRQALMHDAHEAYIGDIPRPLKMFCKPLWDLVPAIDNAIASRFGLVGRDECKAVVKAADRLALATERRDVLGHQLKWDDDPGEPCDELNVVSQVAAEAVTAFRLMFDRLWGASQTRGVYERSDPRASDLDASVTHLFPKRVNPEAKA